LRGGLDGILALIRDVQFEAREHAWSLRRAQRIAGHPNEFIRFRWVRDPRFFVVTQAECDAARAVRAEVRLTFLTAVVEADVVPSDRPPCAGAVELVAQCTSLMGSREGIFLS